MDPETELFVVAHDFSRHSDAALIAALDLRKRYPARLVLLHVVAPPILAYSTPALGAATPIPMDDLGASASKALQAVVDRIGPDAGDIEVAVEEGRPIDRAIVDYCTRREASLLIMGTHGRTGMAHALLGSVAERTLRRSPCPVLTVNEVEEEDGEEEEEEEEEVGAA